MIGSGRLNRLAERLKRHDHRAGEKIFDEFAPKLFRFFVARTARREVAEDLTQEVFSKVVGRIETFDASRGNFVAWMWQIARNTLTDHFRKVSPLPFSDVPEVEHVAAGGSDPTRQAKFDEVMATLRSLSEEEQEIFSLRYLADVPYRDIGRITGKSEGALRVIIQRVLAKLREKLQ